MSAHVEIDPEDLQELKERIARGFGLTLEDLEEPPYEAEARRIRDEQERWFVEVYMPFVAELVTMDVADRAPALTGRLRFSWE